MLEDVIVKEAMRQKGNALILPSAVLFEELGDPGAYVVPVSVHKPMSGAFLHLGAHSADKHRHSRLDYIQSSAFPKQESLLTTLP